MSSQRFAPEFKDEAVRQVVERGYPVGEVAQRIEWTWGVVDGDSTISLRQTA